MSSKPLQAFAILWLALLTPLAGGEANHDAAYNKAVSAMKRAEWDAAAAIFEETIGATPPEVRAQLGPAFGLFYYHLGLCQNQLGQHAAASRQFEICYKKYANRKHAKSINPYHTLSLNHWAQAEQAQGRYNNALKLYRKFVEACPPEVRAAARASIRHAEAPPG